MLLVPGARILHWCNGEIGTAVGNLLTQQNILFHRQSLRLLAKMHQMRMSIMSQAAAKGGLLLWNSTFHTKQASFVELNVYSVYWCHHWGQRTRCISAAVLPTGLGLEVYSRSVVQYSINIAAESKVKAASINYQAHLNVPTRLDSFKSKALVSELPRWCQQSKQLWWCHTLTTTQWNR